MWKYQEQLDDAHRENLLTLKEERLQLLVCHKSFCRAPGLTIYRVVERLAELGWDIDSGRFSPDIRRHLGYVKGVGVAATLTEGGKRVFFSSLSLAC